MMLKMTSRGFFYLSAWLCLCFLLSIGDGSIGTAKADPAAVAFEQSELAIDTAAGKLQFKVELAVTPAQRQRGLMFRQDLPADAGMLFDFGRPAPASMWMRNTYIPLDMLFIRDDGHIAKIASNTEPLSETVIASGEPVRAVLELRGGISEVLGIKAGDRVVHAMFAPTN